jgi:hypothetical protein
MSRPTPGQVRASYQIRAAADPELPPALPPIIGGDLWRQVMDRADGQCECESCTPRNHGTGRCRAGNWLGKPLHAVPRSPVISEIAAAGLGADGLMALCDACHGTRQRQAVRAASRRERWESQTAPALFPATPVAKQAEVISTVPPGGAR